jgi:hypothetical protein
MTHDRYEVLRETHNRLRLAAQAIAADAMEADADHILVPRHRLKLLERELRREPQPRGDFFTLSAS